MGTHSNYSKPYFTLTQQVEQLKSRGMDCGEETKAYEYLERYGDYRLSGYWYPFRILDNPRVDDEGRERRLEEFEPGITL